MKYLIREGTPISVFSSKIDASAATFVTHARKTEWDVIFSNELDFDGNYASAIRQTICKLFAIADDDRREWYVVVQKMHCHNIIGEQWCNYHQKYDSCESLKMKTPRDKNA